MIYQRGGIRPLFAHFCTKRAASKKLCSGRIYASRKLISYDPTLFMMKGANQLNEILLSQRLPVLALRGLTVFPNMTFHL